MTALNIKVIRDLRTMKAQAVAIVLIMASGVAMIVMSLSTVRSLNATLTSYYDRYAFGHVFAHLKRAPNTAAGRIAEIPGVSRVQTRVVVDVTLDIAGLAEPAVGRLISLGAEPEKEMNAVHLRRGRYPDGNRPGELLVNEAFSQAHGLNPGDTLRAVINGRLQTLRIVGIGLSPEYVFQIRPGEFLPDDKHFGVLWIPYAELAPAFDLLGAFNDLSLRLAPNASEPEVLRRVDGLIERYGGQGAHGRSDQLSHRRVSDELLQLRAMALIPPAIFLTVTAFLLNVVMTRLVHTQRQQVAVLKAFGYTKKEVALHFLKLVLIIVAAGVLVGVLVGIWLGNDLARLYVRYLKFPELTFRLDAGVVFLSAAIAAGASLLGVRTALHQVLHLSAAEAMRPEPPARYRPTMVERLGLQRIFSQTARMILRELERKPLRAVVSSLGISLAIAILILGSFAMDSVDYVMDFEFFGRQRHDITVGLVEPASRRVLHELGEIPGVLTAEPFRSVPVRLRSGHRVRRLAIMGLPSNRQLFRLLDRDWREIALPPAGLVLSEKLAEVLGTDVGDSVTVEILEGKRSTNEMVVSAVIRDFVGTAAYAELQGLNWLMQEGDVVSGAFLLTDDQFSTSIFTWLKNAPRVAGVSIRRATVAAFQKLMSQNLLRMRLVNVSFACVIAFGVVYNTARISLSERSRELATLRVIGFTRREISFVLLGEIALFTLAAIPVGVALGHGFAAVLTATTLETETHRIPAVVTAWTNGFAVSTILVASLISGLMVRRRLDRLDLLAVLKAAD